MKKISTLLLFLFFGMGIFFVSCFSKKENGNSEVIYLKTDCPPGAVCRTDMDGITRGFYPDSVFAPLIFSSEKDSLLPDFLLDPKYQTHKIPFDLSDYVYLGPPIHIPYVSIYKYDPNRTVTSTGMEWKKNVLPVTCYADDTLKIKLVTHVDPSSTYPYYSALIAKGSYKKITCRCGYELDSLFLRKK